MKRPLLALAVSLVFGPVLAAQDAGKDTTFDRIFKEGTERGQVMKHLEHLTQKIGPRLTGSARCRQACEWARGQFESWGLRATLDEWNTIEKAFGKQIKMEFNRGPWSAQMLSPEKLDIECTTPSWGRGTNGRQEGPAILMPIDAVEAASLGDKIKGAWIVVQGEAKRSTLDKCEELGALGFLRISRHFEDPERLFGGGDGIRTTEIPKRVNITLQASMFKKIVAYLEDKKEVRLAFDIMNEFVFGHPPKSYNVIADIVGSEKPDEYVVVGGHIDSWDGAQGCTDNGTGTSTTLEAARILAAIGAKPRRTIRFMLWSGEEQGLLGSDSWCARHKDLMPKISACFVHDGGTNVASGLKMPDSMKPLFQTFCEPLMRIVPDSDDPVSRMNRDHPFKLATGRIGSAMGGSDHMSFLARGVPAFFWDQEGRVNYFRGWHTQHDKYEIAVPEYQQRTAIVVAQIALGVANLDALLPRETPPVRRTIGLRFLEDELTVEEVEPDLPGEKAGVKVGDKVLKIGGQAVTDRRSRRRAINEAPSKSTLVVLRDGKEMELPLELPGEPTKPEPGPAPEAQPEAEPPPRLGVNLLETQVTGLTAGMPAEAAGLKVGDVILKVGDTAVTDTRSLRAAIQAAPKETTVTVTRNGKELTLKVVFPK